MNFFRKLFNRPLIDLKTLAAGLLVDGYSNGNGETEESMRAYAKVRYLDFATRYGLPMSFAQEVEDMVAAQYRPDVSHGLALFD